MATFSDLSYAASEIHGMDVARILAELKSEREQIEGAIESLEQLARGRGRRRGRPPAWLAPGVEVKRRGRPPGSKNRPTLTSIPEGIAKSGMIA